MDLAEMLPTLLITKIEFQQATRDQPAADQYHRGQEIMTNQAAVAADDFGFWIALQISRDFGI